MADFNFERLSESASTEEVISYINRLTEELDYILRNIDDENLTDNARHKLYGG